MGAWALTEVGTQAYYALACTFYVFYHVNFVKFPQVTLGQERYLCIGMTQNAYYSLS